MKSPVPCMSGQAGSTVAADRPRSIVSRAAGGSRPRSTARQLSSFRRFFRYLMREGVVREDPTAQIAMPRIGRSLPKSLTEAEVESLLALLRALWPVERRATARWLDRLQLEPANGLCRF